MNRQTVRIEGARAGVQFESDLEEFRNRFGLKIRRKEDSLFMKFLYVASFMWIWNKDFLTTYTTTIGRTVYTERPWPPLYASVSDLALLRHEAQHVEDSLRFGRFGWALLYLFPQSLSLLAFLSYFHPIWLVSLAFLGPWPAPFRVWAELRGYARAYDTWTEYGSGWSKFAMEEKMRKMFCGWAYFRMSWNWARTSDRLMRILSEDPEDVD